MIEAHYTLTLDDFREANGLPAVESARMRWGRWKLLGWVLVVGGFSTFFFLYSLRIGRQGPRFPGAEPFPFTRLAVTMFPALGLCLLFAFIMFRTVKKPPLKPWLLPTPEADENRPGPNMLRRTLMGWVLFVSLATVFFIMMQTKPSVGGPGAPTPPTRLPMTFDFVLPFVPIFFLLLVIGIFAGLSSKRTFPIMWESMRHEQAPRTLRADESALLIEQATASMRYDWPHFAGYKETKNLLLLYLSPHSFHMIPKRAFTSATDLDAFKGLLMNGVTEGTFLPSAQAAFPVVPMAKLAPGGVGT